MTNKHPRPGLVAGFLGEHTIGDLWKDAPFAQRMGPLLGPAHELHLVLNLMSLMHDAVALCARITQASTNSTQTRLLHGIMALLFQGLATSERRTHELAGMNADNPSVRKAAYNAVANKAPMAGKQHTLPTDVLAWHKTLGDMASKKRPASGGDKRPPRRYKAQRPDGFPRAPDRP